MHGVNGMEPMKSLHDRASGDDKARAQQAGPGGVHVDEGSCMHDFRRPVRPNPDSGG
jgi:hypothetical protein